MPSNSQKSVVFAGIDFNGLFTEQLLSYDHFKIVITLNADIIAQAHENLKLRRIIKDSLTTFDGQVPFFLARMLNRNIQFEKISGSDLIYQIAEYAQIKNEKIFLLGGCPESNALAIKRLKNLYQIEVAGYCPPYASWPFPKKTDDDILSAIARFRPHYIFVCLGCPKQEFWLDQHKNSLSNLGIKLGIGAGGVLEMVSGQISRAPVIIQKSGLEGVYRLFRQPKLFRLKRLINSLKIFKLIYRR